MTVSFLQRPCPLCGEGPAFEEVHSTPRGELLPLDQLVGHWSGLFKEKAFFTYSRCDGCGLVFAPTFFTPAQLGDLYGDMAPNMDLVPEKALDATQRSYWQSAKSAGTMSGGYLEIGPDIGYIVRQAALEGNFEKFWLFEPNQSVHAHLADATGGRPSAISAEMDNLSDVPDGSIGLAVMVHVLDHILDPIDSLQRIRQKLKPDGVLMIVTHNEKSLLRRVMGKRWPPFCLQHPELYNPATVTKVLLKAGYSSVDVKRSKNYFPLSFIIRQAAFNFGINLDKLPLPNFALGLKLGNMITLARW